MIKDSILQRPLKIEQLDNIALDAQRKKVFGEVLRPVAEIGRKAVIDELNRYYDFCAYKRFIKNHYNKQ